MNERFKELRKNLGLTQQEFADSLGVRRSTISNYEVGRNNPVDSVISLVCREHHVSESWLRFGTGDMFIPAPTSTLDKLKEEFNLNSFDSKFVAAYLKLTPEQRESVKTLIDKVSDPNFSVDNLTPAPVAPSPSDMTPEQLHSELDRQISLEQRAMEKSVV